MRNTLPSGDNIMRLWQKGYDIQMLRALARPFRLAHQPHVYGAFGLIKERDIAQALSAGQILWTNRDKQATVGTSVGAACIFRDQKRPSVQRDFLGAKFTIPKGAVH